MAKVFSISLVIIVLASLSGCGANVRTYTFEIDRPDQKLEGNKGYLMGQPPAKKVKRETKRTIIGVDVELPTTKEFIDETGIGILKSDKSENDSTPNISQSSGSIPQKKLPTIQANPVAASAPAVIAEQDAGTTQPALAEKAEGGQFSDEDSEEELDDEYK